MPAFSIDTGHRKPKNKLEAHLIDVAQIWCNHKAVVPIHSIAEFQKRLESEVAWFCKDNPGTDPETISIGQYDESMIYIKPSEANVRATATIHLIEEPVLAD